MMAIRDLEFAMEQYLAQVDVINYDMRELARRAAVLEAAQAEVHRMLMLSATPRLALTRPEIGSN